MKKDGMNNHIHVIVSNWHFWWYYREVWKEWNKTLSTIDTAAKIAEALNVTIDYLVKDAEYQNIDDATLKRMQNIESVNILDQWDAITAIFINVIDRYNKII
jgi:transcriptional regulator with XRE-family HTH domain